MSYYCSVCHQPSCNDRLLQPKKSGIFCRRCLTKEFQSAVSKDEILLDEGTGNYLLGPSGHTLIPSSGRPKEKPKNIPRAASKRPLRCPHLDCHRFVSVYELTAHFQHDHPEVPIKHTSLNVRNLVSFQPNEVRYGVKQCLTLLNISPHLETTNASRLVPSFKHNDTQNKVTMAVLISKIGSIDLSEGEQESVLVPDDDTSSIDFMNNDKILVWVASNVATECGYSVTASNVEEEVKVKYFGPVLELNSTPADLCKEGKCLILSYFHILGMSEEGSKPISLNVFLNGDV